jgi:hypothetical protein
MTLRQQWRQMVARHQRLPMRQRLLVLAVIIVVGYLATDEFSWSVARKWEQEGNRIEGALQRNSQRDQLVTTDLRRAVAIYGEVKPPSRNDEGGETLSRAIDEVLRKHKVAGHSFDRRSPQRMKDPDSSIFGGAGLDRLQAEVKFEANADELPRILADLEAHPDVAAITSLRIQRSEPSTLRRISVNATIETWVQASKGRRRT